MLRKLTVHIAALLWVFASFGAHGQATQGPSFDCRKAKSSPEKIICADAELSRLDRELADLYRAAKAAVRDPQEFQKASAQEWRIREETCRDRGCLIQWYEKRKLQLAAISKSSIPATSNRETAINASTGSVVPAPQPVQSAPDRGMDTTPSRPSAATQIVAAPIVTEDSNTLAAKLIAKKQEYASARAMLSVGGSMDLTPTLEGIMGTDSFGEKPWCLVSLPGRGPEAAKGVGKWRLVYRREKAKGDDLVFTGVWEGGSAPPRVSFDDDTSFINAPGAAISAANSDFGKRLATAKTVTFKHTADIVFTYDAQQLRLAQAIARRACP